MLRILLVPFFVCLYCLAQTSSVEGLVVTNIGRQPIRKASVIVTAITPEHSYAIAITDSAGRFRVTGLPAGKYRIAANHAGFLSVPYGSHAPGPPSRLLELAPGQARSGVMLLLSPESSVSGRVLDPDGGGVGRVEIAVFAKQWKDGIAQFAHVASNRTDQDGRYTISGLTAGEYWVAVLANFIRATPTRATVIPGVKAPQQMFLNQYYPGVARFANAAPLVIGPSQDAAGVDFHLSYVPETSLHGMVEGLPPGDTAIIMTLLPDIPGTRYGMVYIPIHTDRRAFALAGIAAGQYRMLVEGSGRRGMREVQLDQDENRVDIELPPGVGVKGLIGARGLDPSAWKDIQITLSPADGVPSQDLHAKVHDGAFEFGNVPAGMWAVQVSNLPAGTYLDHLRFGDQDVLGKPMTLTMESKAFLEIALAPNAAKVSGVVEQAVSATILAVPQGDLAQRTALYRGELNDEEGRFSFDHLAPGPYLFCALQDVEPNAWQDPRFLPKIASSCKRMELKEASLETLQLTAFGVPRL